MTHTDFAGLFTRTAFKTFGLVLLKTFADQQIFTDPFVGPPIRISFFIFLGINFSQAITFKPPLWIIVIIVFRDLFIISGLTIIFLTTDRLYIRPLFLGKLTTFFQMATIFTVLAQWQYANMIWFIAAFLTIASTVAYLLQGIRVLNTPSKTVR